MCWHYSHNVNYRDSKEHNKNAQIQTIYEITYERVNK